MNWDRKVGRRIGRRGLPFVALLLLALSFCPTPTLADPTDDETPAGRGEVQELLSPDDTLDLEMVDVGTVVQEAQLNPDYKNWEPALPLPDTARLMRNQSQLYLNRIESEAASRGLVLKDSVITLVQRSAISDTRTAKLAEFLVKRGMNVVVVRPGTKTTTPKARWLERARRKEHFLFQLRKAVTETPSINDQIERGVVTDGQVDELLAQANNNFDVIFGDRAEPHFTGMMLLSGKDFLDLFGRYLRPYMSSKTGLFRTWRGLNEEGHWNARLNSLELGFAIYGFCLLYNVTYLNFVDKMPNAELGALVAGIFQAFWTYCKRAGAEAHTSRMVFNATTKRYEPDPYFFSLSIFSNSLLATFGAAMVAQGGMLSRVETLWLGALCAGGVFVKYLPEMILARHSRKSDGTKSTDSEEHAPEYTALLGQGTGVPLKYLQTSAMFGSSLIPQITYWTAIAASFSYFVVQQLMWKRPGAPEYPRWGTFKHRSRKLYEQTMAWLGAKDTELCGIEVYLEGMTPYELELREATRVTKNGERKAATEAYLREVPLLVPH